MSVIYDFGYVFAYYFSWATPLEFFSLAPAVFRKVRARAWGGYYNKTVMLCHYNSVDRRIVKQLFCGSFTSIASSRKEKKIC